MLKCIHKMNHDPGVCLLMIAVYMAILEPLDSTTFLVVTYTALVDGQLNSSTLKVKKANSSYLFIESRRKSIQFSGSLVSPDTCQRTSSPLFSRVDSFKLYGMYVSHTTYNREAAPSCFSR